MNRISAGPEDGEQFTHNRRGGGERWAGHVVMEVTGGTEAQAAHLIRAWVDNGALQTGEYRSPSTRKNVAGIAVNQAKLSEMRHSFSPAPE